MDLQDKGFSSVCDQARYAESCGFDSFFVPERHFQKRGSVPDPLLLLAGAAAVTTRITLGTGSWLLPIREPLLAAEQAAALDELSQGRLILGLGRGFDKSMFEAFDVAISDKREQFQRCLHSMIAAWTGTYVSRPGAEPVQVSPVPVQQPFPPLWIAAFGPLALTQAGSLGLPYLASPRETAAQLQANFDIWNQALIEQRHAPVSTRPLMRMVFISENKDQLRHARELMPEPLSACTLCGDPQHIQAEIEQIKSTLQLTHLIAVTPPLHGLEPEQAKESMRLLREII